MCSSGSVLQLFFVSRNFLRNISSYHPLHTTSNISNVPHETTGNNCIALWSRTADFIAPFQVKTPKKKFRTHAGSSTINNNYRSIIDVENYWNHAVTHLPGPSSKPLCFCCCRINYCPLKDQKQFPAVVIYRNRRESPLLRLRFLPAIQICALLPRQKAPDNQNGWMRFSVRATLQWPKNAQWCKSTGRLHEACKCITWWWLRWKSDHRRHHLSRQVLVFRCETPKSDLVAGIMANGVSYSWFVWGTTTIFSMTFQLL